MNSRTETGKTQREREREAKEKILFFLSLSLCAWISPDGESRRACVRACVRGRVSGLLGSFVRQSSVESVVEHVQLVPRPRHGRAWSGAAASILVRDHDLVSCFGAFPLCLHPVRGLTASSRSGSVLLLIPSGPTLKQKKVRVSVHW